MLHACQEAGHEQAWASSEEGVQERAQWGTGRFSRPCRWRAGGAGGEPWAAAGPSIARLRLTGRQIHPIGLAVGLRLEPNAGVILLRSPVSPASQSLRRSPFGVIALPLAPQAPSRHLASAAAACRRATSSPHLRPAPTTACRRSRPPVHAHHAASIQPAGLQGAWGRPQGVQLKPSLPHPLSCAPCLPNWPTTLTGPPPDPCTTPSRAPPVLPAGGGGRRRRACRRRRQTPTSAWAISSATPW